MLHGDPLTQQQSSRCNLWFYSSPCNHSLQETVDGKGSHVSAFESSTRFLILVSLQGTCTTRQSTRIFQCIWTSSRVFTRTGWHANGRHTCNNNAYHVPRYNSPGTWERIFLISEVLCSQFQNNVYRKCILFPIFEVNCVLSHASLCDNAWGTALSTKQAWDIVAGSFNSVPLGEICTFTVSIPLHFELLIVMNSIETRVFFHTPDSTRVGLGLDRVSRRFILRQCAEVTSVS